MPVTMPLGPLTGLGGDDDDRVITGSVGSTVEEEGIVARLGAGSWTALQPALLRAVERGDDGETFAWRGEEAGLAGTVTPVSAYFGETGSVCRQVTITADRSAESEVFMAEACRAESGHWHVAPASEAPSEA